MIRAGVFIGVDRTGGLRPLRDAALGARRMHEWALAQGMENEVTAKLITDADGGRVTPDDIYDAIVAIVDGPGADQLIVYYAGHGVNINRSEHWLLTDAPRRTGAAVSLAGSADLAGYCGIGHVVFISDACRVAPEGIQAQGVRGQEVFPNDGLAGRARPVDRFYACLLGRTAAEIEDPELAAGAYRALYTRALLEGLRGEHSDLLDPSEDANDTARYVMARRLQDFLEAEVPRRVSAQGLAARVNQDPDAVITSVGLWLSRLADVAAPVTRGGGAAPAPRGPAPLTRAGAVSVLTHAAVTGGPDAVDAAAGRLGPAATPVVDDVAAAVAAVSAPFHRNMFETECGINVRGARVVEAVAARAGTELLDGATVRVHPDATGPETVLLTVDGPGLRGCGTVVPAIPEFVARLTFDDQELVDLSYEPAANSWRWELFEDRAQELRWLRGVAAWSSRTGRFRLDGDDADAVARQLQIGKGVDPTLAVYAAHAYHDLQQIDRIREMSEYLAADVGVRLFDLELLGRRLVGTVVDRSQPLVPPTPLLAQGWSLLRAHRVRMPAALDGLEREVRNSLWSLYTPRGVGLLQQAIATGEVR